MRGWRRRSRQQSCTSLRQGRKLVARPRLIERLNSGIDAGHKLAFIAAPAGFGKTTLLGAWAAQKRLPIAWLSLEDNDNDVARFLTYVVAALQTLAPDIGADALDVAGAPVAARRADPYHSRQ